VIDARHKATAQLKRSFGLGFNGEIALGSGRDRRRRDVQASSLAGLGIFLGASWGPGWSRPGRKRHKHYRNNRGDGTRRGAARTAGGDRRYHSRRRSYRGNRAARRSRDDTRTNPAADPAGGAGTSRIRYGRRALHSWAGLHSMDRLAFDIDWLVTGPACTHGPVCIRGPAGTGPACIRDRLHSTFFSQVGLQADSQQSRWNHPRIRSQSRWWSQQESQPPLHDDVIVTGGAGLSAGGAGSRPASQAS